MKQKLTNKEEEVLEYIWQLGPCAPKDVVAAYDAPQPHINTVATAFQALERKGYLTHSRQGRGYVYTPTVARADYGRSKLSSFVGRYFGNSYKQLVSAFVADEHLTADELVDLLDDIKKRNP